MAWWIVFLGGLLWGQSVWAMTDISPAFLGMYRKTIEVERDLYMQAARYGVDHRLARSVILQDSGGNADWVSPGGGGGYFQMPSALVRALGNSSNIEAGIKYLAQLQNQFEREDYVLAAYKLGPDLVQEDEPIHFKMLQYVVSIGYYKSVLQEYEPEVRRRVEQLRLREVQPGESWESVAQALRLTPTMLRLYNPMLAKRFLQGGSTVVYPMEIPPDLVGVGENPVYVVRIGDTPELLANVFQVDPQTFRQQHQLWYLHPLAAGKEIALSVPSAAVPDRRVTLPRPVPIPPAAGPDVTRSGRTGRLRTIPPAAGPDVREKVNDQDLRHTVRRGDSLERIARRYGTTVRALRVVNGLRGTQINIGTVLRIPTARTETTLYRVRWGDTLGEIARRYNTTITTLARINNLRSHDIQAGQVLRIPGS